MRRKPGDCFTKEMKTTGFTSKMRGEIKRDKERERETERQRETEREREREREGLRLKPRFDNF
jgi:hypothetical protein